jgi:hypothetical protein
MSLHHVRGIYRWTEDKNFRVFLKKFRVQTIKMAIF